MLSIAIVEDNEEEGNRLEEYLLRYSKEAGEEIKVSRFSSAFRFLDGYKAIYDVVFMDIEMPDMNGMTAATKLREFDSNIFIIFVTNIAKYAIDGYKVDAFDYFLKPAHYADIRMRMERICQYRKYNGAFLRFSYQGGMIRIPTNEITYIESIGHNIFVHTVSESYLYRGTSMKKLESELAENGFFRCNTCYIVNLKFCTSLDGFSVKVKDTVLQVSRERKTNFINALMRYFRA
ncbi:MAG: response regulator transcription factor [Clostridia bacterium]|nr:response regulator transcription factor [Clostridia bacterium]